jgi:hypothetical protein
LTIASPSRVFLPISKQAGLRILSNCRQKYLEKRWRKKPSVKVKGKTMLWMVAQIRMSRENQNEVSQ